MQIYKGRAFLAEGEALGWETFWSGRGTMWGWNREQREQVKSLRCRKKNGRN